MIKIINKICSFLKYVLLFIAFGMTLFVILGMYARLHKSIIESLSLFLPFLLLLIVFSINIFADQKSIKENVFYNITSVMSFGTIIFAAWRSIFDKAMVLNAIMGYNINFSYYADFIAFMKIMLYGLFIANVVFMFIPFKKENIANKAIEEL